MKTSKDAIHEEFSHPSVATETNMEATAQTYRESPLANDLDRLNATVDTQYVGYYGYTGERTDP
jgi:hypothetical protein